MNNRDRLNKMSNEELANFIHNKQGMCGMCINGEYSEDCEEYTCSFRDWRDCNECIKDWLENEVE